MRPNLSLPRAFRGSDGSESWCTLLVGCLGMILLWARAPFATSNFYAEDGARFFSGARSSGLFESLKEPVGGYFHLIPRLIGAASAQVPITRAPLMTGLLVLFVVAWANMTIYLASSRTLTDRWSRALLALSVTLLPIVGFESISNSANLHFILVCASMVVLMGAQQTPWRMINDSALVIVTGLSTPLVLALLPVAGYRWWRDRRGEVSQTIPPVVVGWAIGTAGQFGSLAILGGGGTSRWGGDPGVARSAGKTLFLLLERVLGYNFLPFWPRISAEDYSHGVTSDLVVRALILVVFGGLLVVFFLRSVRVGLRCKETDQVLSVVVSLSVGIGYWLFLATVFSAEPRYAVFPAFCVLYCLLTSVGIYREPGRKERGKWPKVLFVPLMVIVGFASHWTPSEIRSDGPTWSAGLYVAAEGCRVPGVMTATVPIIPIYANWTVELNCEELLSAVGGFQS